MTWYNSVDELWIDALRTIVRSTPTESRLGPMRELCAYTAGLYNIDRTFLINERRALSPYYACAETLWYLSRERNVDMIAAYAPQYRKFAETDGEAHGAYGDRWRNYDKGGNDQINDVIRILQKTPHSRQAIVTMWSACKDLGATKRDLPCTISMQFLIRNDKLNCIVTMRSNDAWLGLPYDIFAFTCVQRLIADELRLPCGWYVHQAGSEHLYEKDWSKVNESIDAYTKREYDDALELNNWRPFHREGSVISVGDYLGTILSMEQNARVKGELSTLLQYGPSGCMLDDFICACCDKWADDDLPVHSPALRKGRDNVNSRRK